MRLDAALTLTAAFTPDKFDTFARHLDRDWIEEALLATGTGTVRRRRLPAQQIVWLVIGMALMRDRAIVDVARHLDLALPDGGSGARAWTRGMRPRGASRPAPRAHRFRDLDPGVRARGCQGRAERATGRTVCGAA